MFKLKETPLSGCFEIEPLRHHDDRGVFTKVFHADEFKKMGLQTEFKEQYFSSSKKGVLRGLHYQRPPMDHSKLVYCTEGCVFDVVVDLRKSEATFGKFFSLKLDASKANILFIPKGLAHGFMVESPSATLVYNVSRVYSPEHDSGILWSSLGISWPEKDPIISQRDRSFSPFSDFDSTTWN